MPNARQLMTESADCVAEGDTVLEAARRMRQLGVGALPICGADDRLKGMLTDRDIVVKALGADRDPATTTAGDLAQGEVVSVDAEDDARFVLRRMTEHKVRRLPVIEDHRLVGMVSQADVARALPEPEVGDLLEALSTD
ncbi:CBS domain-containing protein [Streptomyces lichenis]|uniref:CBS domain-containing protein n=1 Tax=Streptomyces lichenis TaxID=2306967 RepID=A0ABT0ID51_9ACTN|nr:CBS domain-containing protein [Streptomyces lichenis]MCK8679256.1 CBS domain-containing protein [Streptomyces lichenis]